MIDAVSRLAEIVASRCAVRSEPVLVGIAGAVSVGKTSLANALVDTLMVHEVDGEVVSTDGFLLPNSVLSERGLQTHKGYPESYDVEALRAFADAVRRHDAEIEVPIYSHLTYDVVDGDHRTVRPDGAVIIEGVNALGALHGRLDLGVYLDAAEADLERWYVTRFRELTDEARSDPSSFYRAFVSRSPAQLDELAIQTWRGINLGNLREHIEPTRALADVVIVKGPDHAFVEVREDATNGGG
jgi:type I pantothenate kinase